MADRVFSKADRGLTIINDMTDTTAESAKYRKICFGQMTLEQIWLAFSHDFMAYLQGTSSDSSRHAKTIKCQRKLKPKSCKTYQSTLSNVIYQDSEYNLRVPDILEEDTEKSFIRQVHFLHDTVTKNRARALNIYMPSFRKLFKWLKHESSLAGCDCSSCQRTHYLFLHPEEQGNESENVCLNCGCGKHYTIGEPSTGCRCCHIFDTETNSFLCLGRFQCCHCYRFFSNCRFHQMNQILDSRPELKPAVLYGNLHICNFCIHGKTARRDWYQAVRKPFELSQRRLEKDVEKVISLRRRNFEVAKEMQNHRNFGFPEIDPEEYLTHRQAAGVMRDAAENIEQINQLLRDRQKKDVKALLGDFDNIIKQWQSGNELCKEDRDLVFAVTNCIMGKKSPVSISADGNTVEVAKHKRRKKS